MSSLSQRSSESHQRGFPYDRRIVCRGGYDPYDRDEYMETRYNANKHNGQTKFDEKVDTNSTPMLYTYRLAKTIKQKQNQIL